MVARSVSDSIALPNDLPGLVPGFFCPLSG
jgi:hypothetical protein